MDVVSVGTPKKRKGKEEEGRRKKEGQAYVFCYPGFELRVVPGHGDLGVEGYGLGFRHWDFEKLGESEGVLAGL